MKKIMTLLLVVFAAAAAGCTDKSTVCGTGTMDVNGACVADVACGAGTMAVAGRCVADVTCGTGTVVMAGKCVASGGITCGAGTTEMNGMCVAMAGVTCGAGTTATAGMCVPDVTCGAGTMPVNGMCVPNPDPPAVYVQIEHLARPGINEALLIGDGFHSGYNATAPTFTGVPPATLGLVVAEAKTVLKALYLGGCLLNGTIPGITAVTGVHPGGMQCHAIGPAIWVENALNGVTLTPASIAASQAYADAVFGIFIPDVMRLDTAVTPSSYETLCGAGPVGLCGGRFVRDDTIDITYDFLLNGAGTCAGGLCGAPNQVNALVSDGVSFDNATVANNVSQRVNGDPTNRQQGHPNVANTFPYSAPPN